jgi:hypothetical protein
VAGGPAPGGGGLGLASSIGLGLASVSVPTRPGQGGAGGGRLSDGQLDEADGWAAAGGRAVASGGRLRSGAWRRVVAARWFKDVMGSLFKSRAATWARGRGKGHHEYEN